MTDTASTPRSGAGRIAGAAALIAGLTVLARIAGFGRTVVFISTVRDNSLGDLYNAANTVPNIVFELVAGGALASLVVPLLAGAVAAGDRDRVDAVASALLTWTLLLLVPLAVLVAVLAGPIVGLLPDMPPEAHEVGARMLRIFAPQLPLYGVGIVLTGILQAHHRFAWPVLAPLLSSVTVMAAYLTYALVDGRGSGLGELSAGGELALSLGTTLGVVVLSLCLLVPLRGLRLRLRPAVRFPGDAGRQVVRLGWAGAVTVGSQQLMVVVVLALAAGDGDLTRFNLAQALYLLPWAVLAVPLATAAYPTLSATAERGDEDGYRAALAGTARTVVLLACLGGAALVAIAEPVTALLGTPRAAPGIVGFAPGLLGYALFALLSRALYARGATASAAAATAAGWAVAAVAALVLTAVLPGDGRVLALALANSVGMIALGVLLVVAVRRRAGAGALAGLPRAAGVGIVAAVAAAAAGWGVVQGLAEVAGPTPAGWASVLSGMLGGVVVAVVFFAVTYPLDRHDLRPLVASVTGRIRRTSASNGKGAS
ncbi:murein biosynthesis integral membrane protein MurJ [Actinoplanes sp. NPDC049599]|uniref:murein biosynthesis integral membrane protein MurJ n=1 Tax=Actinoplanes sp. NPDC049599 TaxID=3363903 RepID=UPI0037950541